jgi:putative phosphoesterase
MVDSAEARQIRIDRMRVGVISDTHGLLRPQAVDALRGVDLIIHAGDIGSSDVLDALRRIAPVEAVRGNVDREPWAKMLPASAVVPLESTTAFVIHDLATLDLDPTAAGFDIVIFGHSHRAEIRTQNAVVYLNPGSAGPRRFSLPITVAHIEIASEGPRIRIVDLADEDGRPT